jgi:hypothetical protein
MAIGDLIPVCSGAIYGADGHKYVPEMKRNLSLLEQSPGGTSGDLSIMDDEHIYVGNSNVTKFSKDTLLQVPGNTGYIGFISGIADDEEYLYVSTNPTSSAGVRKYRKSDMTLVADVTVADRVESIAVDDDFVYIGTRGTSARVYKLDKSNLATVGQSPVFGSQSASTLSALSLDAEYVYVTGGTGTARHVRKCAKSNLSLVAEAQETSDIMVQIVNNEAYVWGFTQSSSSLRQYLKSDMTLVRTINMSSIIRRLAAVNEFLYVAEAAGVVRELKSYNMAETGRAEGIVGTAIGLFLDGFYYYVVTGSIYRGALGFEISHYRRAD